MKTNFMKVSTWAMALCASMAVFTACNDDENGTTPPPAPSVENLGGIVTENMTPHGQYGVQADQSVAGKGPRRTYHRRRCEDNGSRQRRSYLHSD